MHFFSFEIGTKLLNKNTTLRNKTFRLILDGGLTNLGILLVLDIVYQWFTMRLIHTLDGKVISCK